MKKTLITAAVTALVLQSCKSDVDPSEAKRGECCITDVTLREDSAETDVNKVGDSKNPYNVRDVPYEGNPKYQPVVPSEEELTDTQKASLKRLEEQRAAPRPNPADYLPSK